MGFQATADAGSHRKSLLREIVRPAQGREGMLRMSEKIDTLVVGAGQAGLAMSEHLEQCDVPTSCLNGAVSPNAGARDDGIRWSPTARLGMIVSRA